MQKSEINQQAMVVRRKVKTSTTLNRKYVKKPVARSTMAGIEKSPQVKHFNTPMSTRKVMIGTQPIEPAKVHPLQQTASVRMRERKMVTQPVQKKMTASELKEQAIQKALASASGVSQEEVQESKKKTTKMHFGFGRVMLALGCAAAAVFAIVYFVNLNMPDISLKVAAMQTGIKASYPGFVPRDYSISSITSEEGQVTLDFTNSSTGDAFSLYEEKSSWDSNALLTNYVKDAFGENYTIVREQGLTIYISGNDAAWVNGGILFKIKTTSGTLTNKQIRSIATSL